MRTVIRNNNNAACTYLLIIICLVLVGVNSTQAQVGKDTTPQTVTIISAYKPQLRSIAKMNFSAAGLPADTARFVREYRVPVKELYFGYTAVQTTPQEPPTDSVPSTGDRLYVRAGYGNFSSPLLKAGIYMGDMQRLYANIYLDHQSAKGKAPNQQSVRSGLMGVAGYRTDRHEWTTSLNLRMENRYLYGYGFLQADYPKAPVQQLFREQAVQIGMRNTSENTWGINYQPTISLTRFSKKDSITEQTIRVETPFAAFIRDSLLVSLNLLADMTSVKTQNRLAGDTSFQNNLLLINPSLEWKRYALSAHVGVTGYKTNGAFDFMPDIRIAYHAANSRWGIIAGWTGTVQKNTTRALSLVNPFVRINDRQINTIETELYGGVQTSFLRYFRMSAKAGLVSYRHFQLFILDSLPGSNGYVLSSEPKMANWRIQAALSCHVDERFQLNTQLVINGFTGLDNNTRAWNTLPLEWTTDVQWRPTNAWMFQADLYAFAGGQYLLPDKTSGKMTGAVDLSLGSSYVVNRHISAFIQANNLLGKPYQRWQRYPVLGTQVLGGVIFRM